MWHLPKDCGNIPIWNWKSNNKICISTVFYQWDIHINECVIIPNRLLLYYQYLPIVIAQKKMGIQEFYSGNLNLKTA